MSNEKKYLTCAETAKYVRARLRQHFPGVKFSVRSDTYSGGASIRVGWTDGPAQSDVERVVKALEGAGFDGMIDLKYYVTHYLLPNGELILGRCSGTTGSMGVVPGFEEAMPEGAVPVSLGADFIFCNRSISDHDAKLAEALAYVKSARWGSNEPSELEHERRASRIVWDRRPGESLADAEARIIYHQDPQQRVALDQAAEIVEAVTAERSPYVDGTD